MPATFAPGVHQEKADPIQRQQRCLSPPSTVFWQLPDCTLACIDIAENAATKQQERKNLQTSIQAKEAILKNLDELQTLSMDWPRLETIEAAIGPGASGIWQCLAVPHENDLREPQNELEGRYEKSGVEIPFDQWLERKSNLADEIQGLEVQLQREYDAIFTLVREWQRFGHRDRGPENLFCAARIGPSFWRL